MSPRGASTAEPAIASPIARLKADTGPIAALVGEPRPGLGGAPKQSAVSGQLRILILEDEPDDAERMKDELRKAGLKFTAKRVATRDAFIEALETFTPDVALLDCHLPDYSGAEALADERHVHPEIPVVIVTGTIGDEAALELLRAGAKDYVLKSNLVRLPSAVERVILVEEGIRARKTAERAVRSSELQYRRLFEAAKDGILILDADTAQIVDVNPFLIDLLGYSYDEYLGKKLWEIGPFHDVAESKANFAELQNLAYIRYEDLPLETKSGSQREVEFVSNRYMVGDREVIQCNIRDITERKAAEKTIREAEAKYRSLVEQNVAGIAIVRDDGTLGYINSYFAQLAGYSAKKMVGRPLLDFIPETEKSTVLEKLQKQLSGVDGAIQLDTSLLAADGHIIDILVSASPSVYEGRPASIAVILDITERRRAEKELLASEERFRLLIEQAPEAIVVYDCDQDRFVITNKAAERLFGCARDELLKYGPQHFYIPEQPDQRPVAESFAQHNARALAGEEMTYERGIHNALGEDRFCQVTLLRLPSAGRRLLRGSFIDITERKEFERTLIRLNHALRTLSAGNEVLVRATNEEDLAAEMCRVVVEVGGYRMAWIGVPQQDAGKSVKPVAWAGETGHYLETAKITWGDELSGRGPHGRAIRSGDTQVTQQIEGDLDMVPWQQQVKERGFVAVAAFPLKDASGVFAVLTIDAAETGAFNPDELKLLQELADDLAFGIRGLHEHTAHEALSARWRASLEATVSAIAGTVEMRDAYTAGHQRRVARLAVSIADKLGMSDYDIQGISLAGIIHDVGKISVPAEILNKPGKLSKLEYQLIQQHAQAGYEIVKGVDFPWPIAEMVHQHHERLNGSGYPQGLKGEEMVLGAKVLAVADVVEAMMSHRPYRPALGIDAALAEIEKGKGTLFDPAAVDACVALVRDKGFDFDRPDSVASTARAPPNHPVVRACVIFLAAAGIALGLGSSAMAYDLPALNLGETSFFDGAPPVTGPGLYGVQYFSFYSADKFADVNGHKLALPSQDLQLFVPVTQLVFLAQPKVFGIAHPGATLIVPTVASASVNDGLNGAVLRSTTGLGDTILGTFLSFDPIMGPDGPRFAQSVEFDVFVPSGRYNRNIAINPGSNFFSINPFYAATFWATRDWSFSGRFHYLWNATNDAPNASLGPTARTSQAGQASHMNLTTHYQLNDAWGIGLNGYYLQQLTDTQINGHSASGRRERVFGIGPGFTFNLNQDYSIFLNAYREFGAENRTEGNRVILRLNAHL